jgi:hypothetical protein
MRRATLPSSTRREGNVAVIVAACLVTLMGFVALSIDGGMLMDRRRHVQSTADAAAIAACDELYLKWWSYYGHDGDGQAVISARATAAAQGYTDGVNGCTVEVYVPPKNGPFAGVQGHAEVIIGHTHARYFSRIWGTENVSVRARAVARGRTSAIRNAIICLDPYAKAALNAGGNGSISVTGSPVQVNSIHAEAMIANGNGSMTADEFDVGGSPGYSTPGGGSFVGDIDPNSEPIPDPLANLPAPDPNALTVQSNKKIQNAGNKDLILYPGVYIGGITATGGSVTLMPGIYYMQGGGFNIGGTANLTGTGVMIYNAPESNSDTISIEGQGSIILSPMMDGPYQGVLFFQDRTSTTPLSVSGSSGTIMKISGTFYAASAQLSITGNGAQQTIGSQYISSTLVLGGNGSYSCDWTPQNTPGRRDILLVE